MKILNDITIQLQLLCQMNAIRANISRTIETKVNINYYLTNKKKNTHIVAVQRLHIEKHEKRSEKDKKKNLLKRECNLIFEFFN